MRKAANCQLSILIRSCRLPCPVWTRAWCFFNAAFKATPVRQTGFRILRGLEFVVYINPLLQNDTCTPNNLLWPMHTRCFSHAAWGRWSELRWHEVTWCHRVLSVGIDLRSMFTLQATWCHADVHQSRCLQTCYFVVQRLATAPKVWRSFTHFSVVFGQCCMHVDGFIACDRACIEQAVSLAHVLDKCHLPLTKTSRNVGHLLVTIGRWAC